MSGLNQGDLPITMEEDEAFGALERQVAGSHYKDLPIQPVEYIHANKLTYLAGNVVKYISRHKAKGGAADVRKAIHYCELILELEYGDGKID
jgi:hypothetical protein